jgi:hypothetical protein
MLVLEIKSRAMVEGAGCNYNVGGGDGRSHCSTTGCKFFGKRPDAGVDWKLNQDVGQFRDIACIFARGDAHPQFHEDHVAGSGVPMQEMIANAYLNSGIAFAAKQMDEARCIEQDHDLRGISRRRRAISSSKLMNVSERPSRLESRTRRALRLKSSSARITASRLVRAPVVRIASARRSSGISKVVFNMDTFQTLYAKCKEFRYTGAWSWTYAAQARAAA